MYFADEEDEGGETPPSVHRLDRTCRVVLVSGFESFNVDLYKKVNPHPLIKCFLITAWTATCEKFLKLSLFIEVKGCHVAQFGVRPVSAFVNLQAARRVARQCPEVDVRVFSDRDITAKQQEVQEALRGADVFFGSLLFDYDQVEWLREQIKDIPIRLVFESALELMGTTQLGGFKVHITLVHLLL